MGAFDGLLRASTTVNRLATGSLASQVLDEREQHQGARVILRYWLSAFGAHPLPGDEHFAREEAVICSGLGVAQLEISPQQEKLPSIAARSWMPERLGNRRGRSSGCLFPRFDPEEHWEAYTGYFWSKELREREKADPHDAHNHIERYSRIPNIHEKTAVQERT